MTRSHTFEPLDLRICVKPKGNVIKSYLINKT